MLVIVSPNVLVSYRSLVMMSFMMDSGSEVIAGCRMLSGWVSERHKEMKSLADVLILPAPGPVKRPATQTD